MKLLITMKQCEEPHSEQGFSNFSADDRNRGVDARTKDLIRGSETSGRPLKKAKYAWQVKGKGRSNGVSEPRLPRRTMENPSTKIATDSFSDVVAVSRSQGVQCISVQCSDRSNSNGSRSEVVDGENGLSFPSEESAEVVASPSRADSAASRRTADVGHHPNNEMQPSYSLHRWQSKQMAQGIIDNAINNVLGDMGITPLQPERYSATFGDPSTWGHYLNAQNIENEGVVEAIRQQGLQRRRVVDGTTTTAPTSQYDDAERRKSSTVVTNGCCYRPSTPSCSLSNPLSSSNCVTDAVVEENSVPMSYNVEVVAHSDTDIDFDNSSSSDFECEDDEIEDEGFMQQEDLLDTAVSCAINSKGLGVLTMSKSQ